MGMKFAAGPHQELISSIYGATAVKEDATFVLDCQQICLISMTGMVDIPVSGGREKKAFSNNVQAVQTVIYFIEYN